MGKSNLKQEFDYYIAHQNELVKDHEGKFIVIKDKKIIGSYDSEIEAYQDAQKSYELGSFLIQKVEKGEGNYSQTFYSRVSI